MYLRQSTASQEIVLGPFVDSTDGNTAETALTIANTDIKIWKHGGTTVSDKNSGGATHISGGRYYAVLDATDTDTIGLMEVFVHVSGALPVIRRFQVLDEAVYDVVCGTTAPSTYAGADTSGTTTLLSRIGGALTITSGRVNADVTHIDAAAVNTSSAQLGVNIVNAAGTAWGSGAITAGSIAADAITSAKVASDVSAEIADAVWDEARSGHVSVGTFGEYVSANVTHAAGTAWGSGAITAASVATGAITSAKFAAGAIDAAAIANGAIDAATFAADVDAEILSYIVDDATRIDASALNTLSSHDPGATIGTSTLTQSQVTGGAYALNSASFAFNAAMDLTTTQKASVNTEADAALADINLDHLMKSAVDTDFATTVHLGSVIGHLADNGTTATFDRTTDSLEALAAPISGGLMLANVTQISGDSVAADRLEAMLDGTGGITISADLSGSVGSVSGSVGSVSGSVGSVSGNVGGNVVGSVGSVAGDVSGNVSGSVGSVSGNVSGSVNSVVGDVGVSSTSINAIADQVWDEAISGHAGAGSTGETLSNAAASSLDAAGVRAAVGLASANLDTQLGAIQSTANSIEGDTQVIGAAGAGLSAVPWNAAWDDEVQSEVQDAIVANGLDHLVAASVAGTDIVDNSIIAKLVSKSATADWDSYANTTDALEALRDNLATASSLATVEGKIDTVDGIVDAILVDTGTTLDGYLTTIQTRIGSPTVSGTSIFHFFEADIIVDTGTTPWQMLHKRTSDDATILTQNLKTAANANVTSTDSVVGRRESP